MYIRIYWEQLQRNEKINYIFTRFSFQHKYLFMTIGEIVWSSYVSWICQVVRWTRSLMMNLFGYFPRSATILPVMIMWKYQNTILQKSSSNIKKTKMIQTCHVRSSVIFLLLHILIHHHIYHHFHDQQNLIMFKRHLHLIEQRVIWRTRKVPHMVEGRHQYRSTLDCTLASYISDVTSRPPGKGTLQHIVTAGRTKWEIFCNFLT